MVKKQQRGFGLYGQFPPTLQQVIFFITCLDIGKV